MHSETLNKQASSDLYHQNLSLIHSSPCMININRRAKLNINSWWCSGLQGKKHNTANTKYISTSKKCHNLAICPRLIELLVQAKMLKSLDVYLFVLKLRKKRVKNIFKFQSGWSKNHIAFAQILLLLFVSERYSFDYFLESYNILKEHTRNSVLHLVNMSDLRQDNFFTF